jgi:hypothetical protein
MITNWENLQTQMPNIEEQIRNFNQSQDYKYYVDMEEVYYIVFYKQIEYVKKILAETILYLNSNVNLIFIYTFIIQALYDEPTVFSQNYIYILSKLVTTGDYSGVNTIKDFFADVKIKKLGEILSLIYSADNEFKTLIEKNRSDKIEFISRDIVIPVDEKYNNFNCSSENQDSVIEKSQIKKYKKENSTNLNTQPSETRDIEIIEKEFSKLKCMMLFKERDIDIDCVKAGLSGILSGEQIIRELWLGFMLFLFKKFSFSFDEFKKIVEELIKEKEYQDNYNLSLDTFQDLDLPDSFYVKGQVGGNNNGNMYLRKYLKYKAKYLKMKNN